MSIYLEKSNKNEWYLTNEYGNVLDGKRFKTGKEAKAYLKKKLDLINIQFVLVKMYQGRLYKVMKIRGNK